MLPVRAIHVLQEVKDRLLAQSDPSKSVIDYTLPSPKQGTGTSPSTTCSESVRPSARKSTIRMRHAKTPTAYQRWRQRGDCW